MRNDKLLLAAAAAALSTGLYSAVVSAASVTANASANVVQALVITEDNGGIDFGDVSENGAGGTVIIDTAGARTPGGDANIHPSAVGQAGLYTISGEDAKTYTLTIPATTTITGPGPAMTVDNFTNTADGTAATGGEQFALGARLTINAGQTAGAYSGTYTITVEYN